MNPSQAPGDRLHVLGFTVRGDGSHKVQQSGDRSQENPGQGNHKSQNQKLQIWKVTIGCHEENCIMHRRHLNATSLIITMREASQDRLQSILPQDEDVFNMLSPGVKHIPNVVTIVEENLKKTFG